MCILHFHLFFPLCFYFLLHVNCLIRIRKVAATCPMAGVMFSEGGDTSRIRPVACRLPPRAKRPGRRADHSLPSNADVKMLGAMPPRPHSYSWRIFVCLLVTLPCISELHSFIRLICTFRVGFPSERFQSRNAWPAIPISVPQTRQADGYFLLISILLRIILWHLSECRSQIPLLFHISTFQSWTGRLPSPRIFDIFLTYHKSMWQRPVTYGTCILRPSHSTHITTVTSRPRVVKISMLIIWVVKPCGLAGGYRRFGGTYYLHLQSLSQLRHIKATSHPSVTVNCSREVRRRTTKQLLPWWQVTAELRLQQGVIAGLGCPEGNSAIAAGTWMWPLICI
jgi:hypothetical protein